MSTWIAPTFALVGVLVGAALSLLGGLLAERRTNRRAVYEAASLSMAKWRIVKRSLEKTPPDAILYEKEKHYLGGTLPAYAGAIAGLSRPRERRAHQQIYGEMSDLFYCLSEQPTPSESPGVDDWQARLDVQREGNAFTRRLVSVFRRSPKPV